MYLFDLSFSLSIHDVLSTSRGFALLPLVDEHDFEDHPRELLQVPFELGIGVLAYRAAFHEFHTPRRRFLMGNLFHAREYAPDMGSFIGAESFVRCSLHSPTAHRT